MKYVFAKLLSLFVVVIMLFTCQRCTNVSGVSGGNESILDTTFTATRAQLDSLCLADTLSNNFDDWMSMTYTDFETGDPIVRRMFIKDTTKTHQVYYIVTDKDSVFVITKRIMSE